MMEEQHFSGAAASHHHAHDAGCAGSHAPARHDDDGPRRQQQPRGWRASLLPILLLASLLAPASAFLLLQPSPMPRWQQPARARGAEQPTVGSWLQLLSPRRQTPRGLVSSRATTDGSSGGGAEKTSLTSPGGNTPPAPESLRYDQKHKGKEVTFKASKGAEWEVTEGPRSLKDYMALPPSQYSVLDADAIVRMTDDSFRCQIGGISFFGYQMTPVLYVKVVVDPLVGKSTLNIYKIELIGSRIAEIANGTFDVKARNVVAFRNTGVPERKMLMSTVSVQVDAQVPRGNVIPLHILEKGGSLAIAGILNVMVPRFVKILSKDYERWSQGDDSRGAVAQDLDERLLNDA